MKLTAFSRFLIVMLILGGIFMLYRKFGPGLVEKYGAKTEVQEGTSATSEQTTAEPNTANNNQAASETPRVSFDYTAPVPVNGKLKGVVELGASGFNSFIVRIDANKNWKLEKAEFGSSLVYENMATDDDVRNGLKNYIRGMLDFGVGGKDIHFVVSSGARPSPRSLKFQKALRSWAIL